MSELKKALLKEFPNHSENIRKFAKNKLRNNMRVYRIGFDCISGKVEVGSGVLYFGYIDGGLFSGVKVRSVRCKMFTTYCYSNFGGESIFDVGYEDVTDWFIKKYLDIGMCIDGDTNHKLEGTDKISSCIYCGKSYTKKQKIIKRDYWKEI